jgi:hypothetical protein
MGWARDWHSLGSEAAVLGFLMLSYQLIVRSVPRHILHAARGMVGHASYVTPCRIILRYRHLAAPDGFGGRH